MVGALRAESRDGGGDGDDDGVCGAVTATDGALHHHCGACHGEIVISF